MTAEEICWSLRPGFSVFMCSLHTHRCCNGDIALFVSWKLLPSLYYWSAKSPLSMLLVCRLKCVPWRSLCHMKSLSFGQCWYPWSQKHTITPSTLWKREWEGGGGWNAKLLRERPISPGHVCATKDHLENHLKKIIKERNPHRKEMGRDKRRQRMTVLAYANELDDCSSGEQSHWRGSRGGRTGGGTADQSGSQGFKSTGWFLSYWFLNCICLVSKNSSLYRQV